jgi:hypothetical protein
MTEDLKYIQVGDLAKGFTGNILPDSDELVGKSLKLFFEDGSITQIRFNTIHEMTWEVLEGLEKGSHANVTYHATSLREGIYFVDYIKGSHWATTVSLVMDLSVQSITAVVGTLPGKEDTRKDMFSRVQEDLELTTVSVQFLKAAINRPLTLNAHPHSPTNELIGKRIKYVYSNTETYEHIYLNSKLYTWHCLEGVEKGLADTDRCDYFKIAEALYLFVWREKIVPTLGVVIVDLHSMKTTGKLFGYEGDDFGKLTNVSIGAYATLLNVTNYD